jgi:hypothetical protein
MKARIASSLTFLLLSSTAVAAQGLPPDLAEQVIARSDAGQKLDRAKIALGGEIFDLTEGRRDVARMAYSPLPANADPKQQEMRRKMMEKTKSFFERTRPLMREAWAHAYARHFTLAELQAIHAFYISPIGTKLTETMVDMAQEVAPVIVPATIQTAPNRR